MCSDDNGAESQQQEHRKKIFWIVFARRKRSRLLSEDFSLGSLTNSSRTILIMIKDGSVVHKEKKKSWKLYWLRGVARATSKPSAWKNNVFEILCDFFAFSAQRRTPRKKNWIKKRIRNDAGFNSDVWPWAQYCVEDLWFRLCVSIVLHDNEIDLSAVVNLIKVADDCSLPGSLSNAWTSSSLSVAKKPTDGSKETKCFAVDLDWFEHLNASGILVNSLWGILHLISRDLGLKISLRFVFRC